MTGSPGLTTQPAFAATVGAPNTINMIGGSDAQGNFAPGMTPVDANGVPTVLALDSTAAAGNTLLTQLVATFPPSSAGTDQSLNTPALDNILATFTVLHPGAYFVQNQSQYDLQVILDSGSGAATVFILPAGGDNASGGAAPVLPWFTGRIRIAGNVLAQFAARSN